MNTNTPTPLTETAERVARWATELEQSTQIASREGQGKMPTTGDLVRVRVYKERAADLRSLLAQVAALAESSNQIASTHAANVAEIARLRDACSRQNNEISQTLGKALGYPWFKDDPKNFPGATEADGVCVGDHVAESLADETAKRLAALAEERDRLAGVYDVALDLVALWHSPKIEGLPRAERNDAISATRDRLVKAVQAAYGGTPHLADNAKPAQGRSALNPKSEKSDG